MLIAVDGTIGSGKKAIASAIARHFALPYMSTGLHYRAVAYQVMLDGGNPDHVSDALAACDFPIELLEEPDLQSEYIGGFASRVAMHADVRHALLPRQWNFAHRAGGAVLDGRDIGTVVAPDADIKLFLAADFGVRLRRIHRRYLEREDPITLKEVAVDITNRDERDTLRIPAPLAMAEDAILLDTSALGERSAGLAAIEVISTRIASMPRRAVIGARMKDCYTH